MGLNELDVEIKRKKLFLDEVNAQEVSWLDEELQGCQFKDARHSKRFRRLCEQFWTSIGGTIPFACQDWANTKAAYRFLSNDRVTEEERY